MLQNVNAPEIVTHAVLFFTIRLTMKCSASDSRAVSSVSDNSAANEPSSQPHKPLRNTQRCTMASRH